MHSLEFIDRHIEHGSALSGTYDPILVTVSVLVAWLAAYAALGVAERISSAEQPLSRWRWLLAGAGAMGVGVWAMHFLGMLAFRLPVKVTYDPLITALSIAPAILASAVVLTIISQEQIKTHQLLLGGVLMGSGIGTMHYLGMAAMQVAAHMLYDPVLFAFSILVAVALATLALHTNFLARNGKWKLAKDWAKLGAALVMGFAVAGMHYTGMAAVYFFPGGSPPSASSLDPLLLAVLVAIATALILGLAILLAMVDRRLKAAARSARISQNRLMEAIESISDGFCLYDREDRLVISNRRYGELWDKEEDCVRLGDRFETIIRKAASRGMIPEAENRLNEWISERLARHQNPLEPFVEKRSDNRWIRISERKTQEGGIVAVYSDITELSLRTRELEGTLRELQRAQAQLVMKEKMASLGQLVAGICHEVNNPVGAINSSAYVLARCVEKLAAECARSGVGAEMEVKKLFRLIDDSIQTILTGGERVARIVASMKNFSRLDQAELLKTDIHEAIDNTLILLDHELRDRVTVHKQYGQLPEICCYADRLNQVFMNLLLNATQAIEGNGTIWVKTESVDEMLRITIADSGKGITPEHLDRVFDPGFTTKGVGVGTGLGLSICYSIIQDHGGRIGVTSQPGHGATFDITLPQDLEQRLSQKELRHRSSSPDEGRADEPFVKSLAERLRDVRTRT